MFRMLQLLLNKSKLMILVIILAGMNWGVVSEAVDSPEALAEIFTKSMPDRSQERTSASADAKYAISESFRKLEGNNEYPLAAASSEPNY